MEPDVRAAVDGDRAAFARLYRRFARPVFLDLAARLRRREDAEDALQATFLSAWQNLPRLAKPARFVAWLFRIARNKANDAGRRKRTAPVLLGKGDDLLAPRRGISPEAEELQDLIAELRPETRALVMLRAVEGWSAQEVAVAHGMSIATVRRRYARALDHLRDAMNRRTRDDQDRTSHLRVV